MCQFYVLALLEAAHHIFGLFSDNILCCMPIQEDISPIACFLLHTSAHVFISHLAVSSVLPYFMLAFAQFLTGLFVGFGVLMEILLYFLVFRISAPWHLPA